MNACLTALRTVFLVGACWACVLAQAQTFPSRPVTLVVPWPAGGAADFAARTLSKELEPLLGQAVIVENAPGAGGSLGVAKALRAPADGHTLILSSPLDLILAPLSFPSASYKPEDARAIALLGSTDLMLVTRKNLSARNLADLVVMMKTGAERPMTYCAMGSGSLQSILGERIAAQAGVQMLGVPYGGLGPCINDLIGGQIDVAYVPVAGPFPGFVDNGSVKAIAVLGNTRNPRLPQLPLASDTPGFEGFAFSVWAGVHVGAGVTDTIAEQLNRAIHAALSRPALRQVLASTGAQVADPMTWVQTQAVYREDVKRYQAMARESVRSRR